MVLYKRWNNSQNLRIFWFKEGITPDESLQASETDNAPVKELGVHRNIEEDLLCFNVANLTTLFLILQSTGRILCFPTVLLTSIIIGVKIITQKKLKTFRRFGWWLNRTFTSIMDRTTQWNSSFERTHPSTISFFTNPQCWYIKDWVAFFFRCQSGRIRYSSLFTYSF